MKLTDYPLSLNTKNGKIDLQKLITNSDQISDHVLVQALLHVCEEQQKQINQLKATIGKLNKKEGADND